MKIDVEGAEYDVLLGARNTIDKYRPTVLLATHEFHLEGVRDRCLQFLRDRNYEITPTDEGKVIRGLEDFVATPRDT